MTFLEKAKSEGIEFRTDGLPISCPYKHGYEKHYVCHGVKCKECWNREMPNTEPKADEDKGWLDGYEKGKLDGMNDAWDLADKFNNMTITEVRKVLGISIEREEIFGAIYPQDAIAKLKAYEEAQSKIEVGDVVKYGNTEYVVCSIFEDFSAHKPNYCGVDRKGRWLGENNVTKTGKHIDIKSILESIGE